MDFYIFWKFGFCRTHPSLRQLFYPLVNPIVNLSSILISPIISPFPLPSYSSLISHPTFIQLSPNTHSSLIPHSHTPFPTLHLLTSYPQVIHNLSTAFPQPLIILIDLLSTPIFPLLLLFLQSSPL